MDAYDVHRRIGQGTFGVVYLAVHRKSGQPVRREAFLFEVARQKLFCRYTHRICAEPPLGLAAQVAIKRMNDLFPTWEACVQLPEVQVLSRSYKLPRTAHSRANIHEWPPLDALRQALRALHHPNIIQLLQVVRDSNILYLVYECMHMSLLDYMKKYPAPRRDPADVRDIT